MTDFLIIAITRPDFFPQEATRINSLLQNGEVDFVHIRKPFSHKEDVEKMLSDINPENYSKIKLHEHFELVEKYNLGGCHLNQRNREISNLKGKAPSISLHSIQEIENLNFRPEYFFISPIYDSISKPGYKAAFDLKELSKEIQNKRAIALGGVTPDKFPELKKFGFAGAALLSYFFPLPS